MDLSIVVSVYNSANTIRDCVLSILNSKLNKKIKYEVIVVDDGSKDNPLKRIKDLNVKTIKKEKNEGPGPGRNAGAIGLVRGRFTKWSDS